MQYMIQLSRQHHSATARWPSQPTPLTITKVILSTALLWEGLSLRYVYSINDVAKLLVELLFNFRSTRMCNDNPSTLLANEDNLSLCCGKMICLIYSSNCIPLSVYHLYCWGCCDMSWNLTVPLLHIFCTQDAAETYYSAIEKIPEYDTLIQQVYSMQTSSYNVAVQLHCWFHSLKAFVLTQDTCHWSSFLIWMSFNTTSSYSCMRQYNVTVVFMLAIKHQLGNVHACNGPRLCKRVMWLMKIQTPTLHQHKMRMSCTDRSSPVALRE